MSRNLGDVLISKDEDERAPIVDALVRLGLPAQRAKGLPVDLMFTVDSDMHMYDLKTPVDMIASVDDGRLHEQMTAMQKRAARFGFIIHGSDSQDGVTVGYGTHAWAVERYDNLLQSLQDEGAKIVRACVRERLPQRIASLYTYASKDNHGSWHAPSPHHVLHNLYADRTYRSQVEMLMSVPSMGEQRANELLDRWPLYEVLGAGIDGLYTARERWVRVKGIGPKLADTWHSFLTTDFSSALLRAE